MTRSASDTLTDIALRASQHRQTNEVRFAISAPGFRWSYLEDGAREHYFIASITKLATAAIVFQHIEERRYSLDTPVAALLPPEDVDGLPGMTTDRGDNPVTVAHLLAHTSGITDYFEAKTAGNDNMLTRIRQQDLSWDRREAIDLVRGRPALNPPGITKRAHYSDTNYQLLQLIIERHDEPYPQAFQARIGAPLGLRDTYVFSPDTLDRFATVAPFKDGDAIFDRPRAMASFGADGSIVSTTTDQLRFMKGYLGGELFSADHLAAATHTWRPVFFPLEYGLGIMRYRMPRAFSPFSPMPPFIGHSGASGAVLFHDPDRDLTIAGAVNQLRNRGLVYRILSRMERVLR